MSHPCTSCGRFLFPRPRLCYWCITPLSDAERHERVQAGVRSGGERPPPSWAELEAKERAHREKLRQARIRRKQKKEEA